MSSGFWRDKIAYFFTAGMSRRPLSWWDISRLVTAVIVQLAAVYLIAGVGLSIWSNYQTNRDLYRQEEINAQSRQHQASRYIASECAVPGAPTDVVAECLASEIGNYQQRENTNQDLEAQQDMAYWALWMFIVSAAGVCVSLVGVFLLLRSLRQTEIAISTDREVGHAQVRAYMTIEPRSPSDFMVGKKAKAQLIIKNTGQSPAYNVRYIAGILIEDHPMRPDRGDLIEVDPQQSLRTGNTVAAQGEFFAEGYSPDSLTLEELRSAMQTMQRRFYLSCVVYYTDVFKFNRKTMMTAYLEPFGEPIQDPETGRIGKSYSWVIAHTHNHAT